MTARRENSAAGPELDAALGAAELAALLAAAVDGIVVIDERGRIVRFSQAAETMFGYGAAEVLGRALNVLMEPGDSRQHDNYLDRYLQTGKKHIIGVGREVIARRKDGTTFPIALSVGEARLGDQTRFVGLMRDLTAEKRAEEESLRHREQMMHVSRLTTMGEMAAAMAHEINQPLSAIATYTAACGRLMDQGPEGVEEVRRALGQIGAQAHRAADVIQRIRNFSRSRELSRRTTTVRALIEEIWPLAELDAKANGSRLGLEIQADLPPITVDGVQLQQVILNLVRNGIDALAGIPVADRSVRVRARAESPQKIRIEIVDSGEGVSAAARKQLFTPFFTTKPAGMGMGLAISRSIIAAHSGVLDCENNPGGGATFYIILPTDVAE
jgi:two-component system, LuxR family, sensor kinase FixL